MKVTGGTRTGYSYEKLYGVWKSMRQRCYRKNYKHYKDYGGRGITVCDEWKNKYLPFREWALKSGYRSGLTIDRIDNNKGYYPDNCHWITHKQQQFNKRDNRIITINNISKTVTEWALCSGINPKTIDGRLRDGWSGEALISPVKPGKRSDNRIFFINGEFLAVYEICQKYGIEDSTIRNRVKRGWTSEDLLKPKGYRKRRAV